jgi:YD repeat-containing protein
MKTKRSLLIIITLIVAGFALISCNQTKETTETDENVKHFRHILFSETVFDDIRGTYPITAEEADKINNYKFTYDDEGRLVRVEFVRGDELLGYSSTGAAKTVIEYTDNQEIRHFFDENNEPTINRGVFKYVFDLNDDGMRTGLKFYDKEGNPVENNNSIAYYKWEKTKDGLIRENRFNLNDEETVMNEFCPFYELRFTYDENGYVKRMANFQADTMYNCTVENCGDVGVSYFLFDINEKGDLLEFSVHNTVGQYSNLYWGWARFESKYDENGNTVEVAYFDQDNEYLAGKAIPVRQYKYDEHGSVTEVNFMDKERNLMDHPSAGYAVIKYEYKENGHPSDTLRYDKNMELIADEA